jgi:hypothetical protein
MVPSRLRHVFPEPPRKTVDTGSFDYENNRNRPLVSLVRAKRPLAENINSLTSVSEQAFMVAYIVNRIIGESRERIARSTMGKAGLSLLYLKKKSDICTNFELYEINTY